MALEQSADNHKDSKDLLKQDLFNIARTTLSSKILAGHKDHFAKLVVDAVLRLKGRTEIEHIQIIKKQGASLEESYLEEGFILDKHIGVGQPKRLENARILIANTTLDADRIKISAAKMKVDSVGKIADLEAAEKKRMYEKVGKILKHDINCFITRQLIYNLPESMFTDAKVMAIEHADFEGIERLAHVLGGEIVSTFETPEKVRLGHCKLIEEVFIGEDRVSVSLVYPMERRVVSF
jgi:T-complex protein 1 subunit beta